MLDENENEDDDLWAWSLGDVKERERLKNCGSR